MSRPEILRGYPCAVFDDPAWDPNLPELNCDGPVEAHHHTGHRGMSQKNDDEKTFPLCHRHHMDFHDARGVFFSWNKNARRMWQDLQVEKYDRILCDPEAFYGLPLYRPSGGRR